MPGCSTYRVKPARPAAPAHSDASDARQQAAAGGICHGGLPIDRAADVGGTELIVRRGYVLEYSDGDKIPLWVCESVGSAQLEGHLSRRHDRFLPDPLVLGAKAYPADYSGSGFDRGHQAPAGNQTEDVELKEDTFYMSNIAPQWPSFNRGIWESLEVKTRYWVRRYGHAYEWTGPIRCSATLTSPAGAREPCVKRTIGTDAVVVPVYFYKVIVVQEKSGWKALAFAIPNVNLQRPYRLAAYVTSIDWIEQQTDIEFMPDLGSAERHRMKAFAADLWP